MKFRINNILKTSILIVVLLGLVACGSQPLPEQFDEKTVKDSANKVINMVVDQETEALLSVSTETLKDDLSIDALNELYATLDEAGDYKETEEIVVTGHKEKDSEEEYAHAYADVIYKDAKFKFSMTYNKAMELAGLQIK